MADLNPDLLRAVRIKIDRCARLEAQEGYENNFAEFLKAAWHAVDTAEFKPCWAIDALCDHLEAVTLGCIRRLLINIPPRTGKTTCASIAWPAWIWARSQRSFVSGPQVKFLGASYNASLSLEHANKMRRLLMSPWYQDLWGERYSLRMDQNSKSQYDNTEGGSRLATSVRGGLLGRGGDVLCFPYGERVHTEHGPRKIGDLVDGRERVRVWSFDTKSGTVALKPITGWHRNPGSVIVEVGLDDGTSFRCTPDHKVWTLRGWVKACDLRSWDRLPRCPIPHVQNSVSADAELSSQLCEPRLGLSYFLYRSHRKLGVRREIANAVIRRLPESLSDLAPCFAAPHVPYGDDADAEANGDNSGRFSALDDFNSGIARQDSALTSDVLGARSISQIRQRGVGAISIAMQGLASLWAWADEREQHELVAELVVGNSVFAERYARIPFSQSRMEKPGRTQFAPQDAGVASDIAERRNAVQRETRDRAPLFVREVGHVDVTYCLTVADVNTFVVNDNIVHNCVDDPHVTETEKKVESDADRAAVRSWWQELSSTRLNDPKQSAIVVVMQRLHQGDLSGVILDSDEEWTHLMIPMEFDERRRSVTIVLPQYDDDEPWEDPRTEPGELMWPERFGPREVEHLKSRLGPFLASGRLQQSPIPRGGAIIQSDWWRLWDQEEAKRYGLEWTREQKNFPPFSFIVGSLDTSYGEKDENNYNALTIWGIWADRAGNRRVMLMYAWAKRLKLHGTLVSANPGEAKVTFNQRQQREWGLIEWVADSLKRYKAHRLLVENKTRGRDVANEINRLYAREQWNVELINPVGDKVSRVHSIVPLFTDGMIWAPETTWSEEVIRQMEFFPKGEYDDLVDTVSQFLNWARENGILLRTDEMDSMLNDEMTYRPPQESVAQHYGV